MAKRCAITGTGVMSGNNVSHSKRRTRRRFMPNIQNVRLLSDALGCHVPMKITVATLRSIDHNGGLDAYLLKTSNSKLTDEARTLKKLIASKTASNEATA